MATLQDPFPRASSAGAVGTAPEKPVHYTYLKEFRVEQCKLFQQHKCTQHRPYSCFYWHFMNQRRRRPVRRRDGTFNYSPDVYCTMYDENTGLCPNGDDCPYLHRNAGDTERRYHLRYYKTSTCVYETDSRDFCVKNGPHCAFAHGAHDLRSPVYDVREMEDKERLASPLVGSLERDKGVLVDDPRWHESAFVLTFYKTDPCKRPPRLCRQGYACPFYHNNKDKRRGPKTFKYRSTPCPNVKVNDEWGDPVSCEQGEGCCYCHTRTEQQFHPEIYKSTRCNDVQATGYCPRGPFCAFAHDDKELSAPRELTDELMGSEISSVLVEGDLSNIWPLRPSSATTPLHSDSGTFQRAPGAEVRTRSFGDDDSQGYIRKQLQAIESDTSLDENERARRKQNLLRLSFGSMGAAAAAGFSPEAGYQVGSLPSSVSDALEAVVGSTMDDLSLDELESVPGSEHQFDPEAMSSNALLGQSPVAHGFMQSLQSPFSSASFPYSSPLGGLSPFAAPPSAQGLGSAFTPTSPLAPLSSPHQRGGAAITIQQPIGKPVGPPSRPTTMLPSSEKSEIAMIREELKTTRAHLTQWQESWKQAKAACDAWKKEVEEVNKRSQQERDKSNDKIRELEAQLHSTQSLHILAEGMSLNHLSLTELTRLRTRIRADLELLESRISSRKAMLCIQCEAQPRSVLFQPCQHCVLCLKCTDLLSDPAVCPHCRARIAHRTTVLFPASTHSGDAPQ